jgi:HEAT repeat protein
MESSYATKTEFAKRQYQFALQDIGQQAIGTLRQELKAAGGELRKRIAVTLDSLGDDRVYETLIDILSNRTNDGYLRSMAAVALGKLGNRKAVESLKVALNDPFSVTYSTDVAVPGKGTQRITYPVRSNAASALRDLGVEVERDGNSFRVVE